MTVTPGCAEVVVTVEQAAGALFGWTISGYSVDWTACFKGEMGQGCKGEVNVLNTQLSPLRQLTAPACCLLAVVWTVVSGKAIHLCHKPRACKNDAPWHSRVTQVVRVTLVVKV